ncbi:hypothetical protein AGOR_G00240610 [Albula goreensis]|uniref:Glypican-5 n=1 Tax=Albula goreensis TaxID=1534307 RepID=A0A8T3CGK3_9TELE|nr:hypothetical protein AGOR_G00240610 [Albula goreensis]
MPRGIFPRVNFWWILVSSALLVNVPGVKAHSCHEVKTAFQLRQIGLLKWVPETPGTDVDLHICKHNGPTCCTRKMEEAYKGSVQRETQLNLKTYSFQIKYVITRHATAFQDTFQSLSSFSMSHVTSLFESSYPALAQDAAVHVGELFFDLSLFIRGANASVEMAVHRFYDNLFPSVFRRLLRPGADEPVSELDDCLRMTRQDVNPFGPHPGLMAQELPRALQAGRAMSLAMAVGKELVNATEQVSLPRDCARALVRMQYCSHCRGLTLIKPCAGYCLNVMRGCIAGLSDLDQPWKRYLAILQDISSSMAGAHDLELALLGVRSQVNEAIIYAQQNGPRLVATVSHAVWAG